MQMDWKPKAPETVLAELQTHYCSILTGYEVNGQVRRFTCSGSPDPAEQANIQKHVARYFADKNDFEWVPVE